MSRRIAAVAALLLQLRVSFRKLGEWRDPSLVHSKDALLRTVTLAKASGQESNRGIASLGIHLPAVARRVLGTTRSSSSTVFRTIRDLRSEGFDSVVSASVRRALDEGLLGEQHLAGGLMVHDGKTVASGRDTPPNDFCKMDTDRNGQRWWFQHVLRAVLASWDAVVCAGQHVVPAGTGEAPTFRVFWPILVEQYGAYLPKYHSFDAGLTCIENAAVVVQSKRIYIMCVKGNQPNLYRRMRAAFANRCQCAMAETFDHSRGKLHWRQFWRTPAPKSNPGMPNAKQWWLVFHTTVNLATGCTTYEAHYAITNAEWRDLSPKRALKAVRSHWQVENGANWPADVIFHEDTHQPCAKGMGPINNSWLTLLAVNLAAMMRVRLASSGKLASWADVLDSIFAALNNDNAWRENTDTVKA